MAICTEVTSSPTRHTKNYTDLGMVYLLQKWPYLAILPVAIRHLCFQITCKTFNSTAEGLHILLITGITMLRYFMQQPLNHPLMHQDHPGIFTWDRVARDGIIIPIFQTDKTKAEYNRGICLFQSKKGKWNRDCLSEL